MKSSTRSHVSCLALLLITALGVACSGPAPGTFAEPSEAINAFGALIESKDSAGFETLLGPGAMDMLQSGDPVADKADSEHVKALITEKVAFEEVDATTRVALLGNDAWPFPIPIVKVGGEGKAGDRWRFDAVAGRKEIANRRVGRNELDTIASLHALVDAQREYAATGQDGRRAQYARRLISSDGLHDGLYWPSAEGEPASPIGDLVAAAAAEGYVVDGGEPQPFHGYYFRLLEAQGASAPGAARSYVDEAGDMTGGFACVAWPAKHGVSGIMTFLVSHNGIVFQKDLGDDTAAAAAAMTSFDPDATWTPTWEPIETTAPPAAAPQG